MKTRTITFNDEVAAKLTEVATKRSVSEQAIINIALTKYLEEELKK